MAQQLVQWERVDCVVLAYIADTDILDPYFFVSLDVYYRGELPDVEDRMNMFSDVGAFESSSITSKDRFVIEQVPVRLEYKDIGRIDEILQRTRQNLWVSRQTGTYMFYRIEHGRVLQQKSDWIEQARNQLRQVPDQFWRFLSDATQATMEHYLSDLTAAVIRDDRLFYMISCAGFIKSLLSLLFVVNRRFEPSGRKLYEEVWRLPQLPENFKGRFESFLRDSPEFPPSRKQEIAKLLAKSTVLMC